VEVFNPRFQGVARRGRGGRVDGIRGLADGEDSEVDRARHLGPFAAAERSDGAPGDPASEQGARERVSKSANAYRAREFWIAYKYAPGGENDLQSGGKKLPVSMGRAKRRFGGRDSRVRFPILTAFVAEVILDERIGLFAVTRSPSGARVKSGVSAV